MQSFSGKWRTNVELRFVEKVVFQVLFVHAITHFVASNIDH